MGATAYSPPKASVIKADSGIHALFGEDFDAPKIVVPPPEPKPTQTEPPDLVPYFTEQELETARRDGYAAGLADLRAATLEAHEATLAQNFAAISAELAHAKEEAARVAENAAEATARVLFRMLATMLPALCSQHGAREIEAVARRVLPHLKSEPTVTVQLNPNDVEHVEAGLYRLASDQVKQLSLVAVPSVEPGDVRLVWQDGEAVRDSAALLREMVDVLQSLGFMSATADEDSSLE